MNEPARGMIRGAVPIMTNAAVNRSQAIECLRRGMKPEQIAAEWPLVWKCEGGKLGQRYDSWYEADPNLKDIAYTVTSESVEEVLAKLGL